MRWAGVAGLVLLFGCRGASLAQSDAGTWGLARGSGGCFYVVDGAAGTVRIVRP